MRRPESQNPKTLDSTIKSVRLRRLEWRKKSLQGSWNGKSPEAPEEMGEKLMRGKRFKFSPRQTGRPVCDTIDLLPAVNAAIFVLLPCLVILPLPFSVEIPNFCGVNQKNLIRGSKNRGLHALS